MTDAAARSVTGSGQHAGLARRLATTLLSRLEHGALTIVESSGRLTFGHGGGNAIHATMHIRDPAVWRTVLIRGSAGLGETYLEGAPVPRARSAVITYYYTRISPAVRTPPS